jgi:hypothetical protein
MTYTVWLKEAEGFTSVSQYNYLLSSLPYQAQRKIVIYYQEKYKYFLDNRPKQL